jgi:two-component system OmpR family sensor kinase
MENVNKEEVNLKKIIVEVVQKLKEALTDRNIEVEINVPDEVNVMFDKKMLRQLITHIVDNAFKYSDFSKDKNYLKIYLDGKILVFEDNGIGISDENKDKIFEEFFRVDESHTIPGTGIGLNIAKRLAQINGCELKLLESKLNDGSKFALIFEEIL